LKGNRNVRVATSGFCFNNQNISIKRELKVF